MNRKSLAWALVPFVTVTMSLIWCELLVAQTTNYTSTTSTDWHDDTNWSANEPTGADEAIFGNGVGLNFDPGPGGTHHTVGWDGTGAVANQLTFTTTANSLRLRSPTNDASHTLQLGSGGIVHTGTTEVGFLDDGARGTIQLTAAQTWQSTGGGELIIGSQGFVDLNGNKLTLHSVGSGTGFNAPIRFDGRNDNITGSGGIEKTGTGQVWIRSGAGGSATEPLSFSGGLTITAGEVEVSQHPVSLPNSAVIMNGGRLDLGNNFFSAGLDGTTGTVDVNTRTYTSTSTGNHSYGGVWQGAGNYRHNGAGTQTMTSDMGNIKLIVDQGKVEIGNGGTSGTNSSPLAIANGSGILSINQSDAFNYGTAVIGSGTFSQDGTGTTTITAQGFTSNVEVNDGTLLFNAVTTGSATTSQTATGGGGNNQTIFARGTRNWDNVDTTNLWVGQQITTFTAVENGGSTPVVINPTGLFIQSMSGVGAGNTITVFNNTGSSISVEGGNQTITDIDYAAHPGLGGVVVNGGTLGGIGQIGGDVVVNSAGTYAPGESIGTLGHLGNDLSLGGTTQMEISRTTGPTYANDLGYDIDELIYGGTLEILIDGASDPVSLFAPGDNWDLFDFASQSGTFANDSVFGTVGDGTDLPVLTDAIWEFDYTTGVLSIAAPAVNVTPEPASVTLWALIGMGLAGFAWRRRRQG